jgi:tripeptidyl-peptidase-1
MVSPTTYFRQIRAAENQYSGVTFEPLNEQFVPVAASMQRLSASKQAETNKQIAAGQPSSCNASAVSTQCLRDYYQTSSYSAKSASKQFIGISGFLEEYASYSDLQKYLQKQRPEAAKAGYKFTTVELDGSYNDQNDAGVEANLDVQTVAGVGYPIPSTYYSVAGSPPYTPDAATPTNTNEPYTTEFEYLLSQSDDNLPSILSTSYDDDEQSVPVSYQKRVCMEAAALGARGVTVLMAAGDNGVGTDGDCYSNDGKKTRKFLPQFPSSCPYVTSVGATQNFAPERAVGPSYYGGGGFSDVWPMPKYQKKTVKAYVKSLNGKYKGLYNPKGRAYPDLSAQGYAFLITLNGTVGRVSGTSASTPLTAAILGLINDKRLSEGKSRLGFINPALYGGAGAKGLHDITIGSNKGCETDGFPAQKGWDAATGWGTPRFQKLAKALG